jgi:hypothetical protein
MPKDFQIVTVKSYSLAFTAQTPTPKRHSHCRYQQCKQHVDPPRRRDRQTFGLVEIKDRHCHDRLRTHGLASTQRACFVEGIRTAIVAKDKNTSVIVVMTRIVAESSTAMSVRPSTCELCLPMIFWLSSLIAPSANASVLWQWAMTDLMFVWNAPSFTREL